MADIELIKGADNGNPPDTLRQMYPKVNHNFKNINDQLVGHINSNAAHNAKNIVYTGDVAGVDNTEDAIDSVSSRVDNLVVNAGDSNGEVVDARQPASGTPFPSLKARMDGNDVNVKGNKTSIDNHISDSVFNGNGVHGLRIESGLWTPTFFDENGNEPVYVSSGWYHRIGNLVKAKFAVHITDKGILSGGVYMGGSPFVMYGSNDGGVISEFKFCNLSTGFIPSLSTLGNNNISLRKLSLVGGDSFNIAASELLNGFYLEGSVVFMIP